MEKSTLSKPAFDNEKKELSNTEIIQLGKKCLERRLSNFNFVLKKLSHNPKDESAIYFLKVENGIYIFVTNSYKDILGLEFPEVQKKYELLFPQINEYLGVKK